MLIVAIMAIGQNSFAHDFSKVAPSRQMLFYNINGNNVTVTYPSSDSCPYPYQGFTKPTGFLIIPISVKYNGTKYSVTSIGDNAFEKCTGLTSVTIPKSVTLIGGRAFHSCTGEVFLAMHADGTSVLPGGIYFVKIGSLPARKVVVIR